MRTMLATCVLFFAGVLAGCAGQPMSETHDIGTAAITPVNEILEGFHAAAAKSDFEKYFAHWDEQSVFLGTDAKERWTGKEFKDFAKPYFAKGQGWTYKSRERHISISPDGRVAWFDELLDNAKYGECRGSGVVIKQGADWKLVQYNLSIPMPNDLAGEFADRIRRWKKPHQE